MSVTPDLFNYVPNHRARDPITSREAGEAARSFAGWQQREIMRALHEMNRPAAPAEIAIHLGWDSHVTVNRRTTELERAGKIEVAQGDFHINDSGRRARRYRVRT